MFVPPQHVNPSALKALLPHQTQASKHSEVHGNVNSSCHKGGGVAPVPLYAHP
jgi:hypothetical protein